MNSEEINAYLKAILPSLNKFANKWGCNCKLEVLESIPDNHIMWKVYATPDEIKDSPEGTLLYITEIDGQHSYKTSSMSVWIHPSGKGSFNCDAENWQESGCNNFIKEFSSTDELSVSIKYCLHIFFLYRNKSLLYHWADSQDYWITHFTGDSLDDLGISVETSQGLITLPTFRFQRRIDVQVLEKLLSGKQKLKLDILEKSRLLREYENTDGPCMILGFYWGVIATFERLDDSFKVKKLSENISQPSDFIEWLNNYAKIDGDE